MINARLVIAHNTCRWYIDSVSYKVWFVVGLMWLPIPTPQVTISIARDLHPRRVVGMDIDSKLVKIAWKNLHRHYVPSVTPDGRPFPLSFTLARGPVAFPPLPGGGGGGNGGGFPNNVEFVQVSW